jgi:hypothetical protein
MSSLFGSFIYGIESLPHQPLQPEYMDCEESAHKQSATGFDSMALDLEGRISVRTTSTEVIHFLNTGGRETFIPAPIYTYSAIMFLQQKTRFVAEPNSSPVSECPTLHNLTAVRYRDEILQPHLMHVIDRQRGLFQQDNLGHTQRV